jgi:hypothetical protein
LQLPSGGGVYGYSAGLGVFFVVFLLHFLMDNGVPGGLALALGNVIFPGPPPQPKLFDKIQFRHNASHRNPFFHLKYICYSCANCLRLLEYIGLELDSKKVFEILLFRRARGFPFFIIHAELPTQVGSFLK